jgi:hypothetical protein
MTLATTYETGVSVDGSRDIESESESEKETVAQEQSSALVTTAAAPRRVALEVAPSRKKQYVDLSFGFSCVMQMH